jgi:hypothetical protein
MTKDEALRLALEALETLMIERGSIYEKAITAIKASLEAKDEPWEKFCDSHCVWTDHHIDCKLAKDEPYAFEAFMYSNDRVKIDPVTGNVSIGTPQRTLVGLTDEEVWEKVDMRDHAEGNLGIGTAQPQRTWVGLTDEEIQTTWDSVMDGSVFTRREVYKAIEAKLKEKNT